MAAVALAVLAQRQERSVMRQGNVSMGVILRATQPKNVTPRTILLNVAHFLSVQLFINAEAPRGLITARILVQRQQAPVRMGKIV